MTAVATCDTARSQLLVRILQIYFSQVAENSPSPSMVRQGARR
jgi:hypothetical protein